MVESLIVSAVRTPVGKRHGLLSEHHPADLLGTVISEALKRANVDPGDIGDVVGGCVSQVGEQAANVTRNAWLAAGLPAHVPAVTVDRQCGSSQQAVAFASQAVQSGATDVVVACGVEVMSRVPMGSPESIHGISQSPGMRGRFGDQLGHQGLAAEAIAAKWGISRVEMDEFAVRSHERALRAAEVGDFKEEILPVKLSDGSVMSSDQGPRDPDRDAMARLRPAFTENGRITAANSSQISDGAAALVIASDSYVKRHGLRPIAQVIDSVVIGSDPVMMLTGPIPVTRKILDKHRLALSDLSSWEVSEAFASVVLAWTRELNVSEAEADQKLNPSGGAIALGHPLGASGARIMTTLAHRLHRLGGSYGLQVMCEGGGMANATLLRGLPGEG